TELTCVATVLAPVATVFATFAVCRSPVADDAPCTAVEAALKVEPRFEIKGIAWAIKPTDPRITRPEVERFLPKIAAALAASPSPCESVEKLEPTPTVVEPPVVEVPFAACFCSSSLARFV